MREERRTRRQFTSEEKAATVKQHVVGGESIFLICDHLGLAPNLFYHWHKELFDNESAAFEVKTRGLRPDTWARKLETISAKWGCEPDAC